MKRSTETILALGMLVLAFSVAFVVAHPERIALAANAGLPSDFRLADFSCPTGFDKDKNWHSRISYVSGFKNSQPVCTELDLSTMGQGLSFQEQENDVEGTKRIYFTINLMKEEKK